MSFHTENDWVSFPGYDCFLVLVLIAFFLNLGKACFLCESSLHPAHVNGLANDADSLECPLCTSPSISLNLNHGQRILEHLGAHILFDEKAIRTEEPCG